MTNKDLATRLRQLAVCADDSQCAVCGAGCGDAMAVLREAADALDNSIAGEELLEMLQIAAKGGTDCTPVGRLSATKEDMDKTEWISVDKAPNTDSGVVGFFNGGALNQLYWYDFITTMPDGSIVPANNERDIDNIRCVAVFKLPDPPGT